ncbi:MAG: hypothetical protein IT579_24705 [Verrucomicrobia subdivision 3 bacterium]|nr:hypothetical protein [Limisphaerales bacterium]
MKKKIAMFAAAGVVAVFVSTVQAQPYYVSGSALTPAWAPGTPENELTGGPTVYSLTTATIADTYHGFKVTGASWGDPNWPGNDVKIKGDANGTNTFYFFPGTTVDGWLPLANRIGYTDPGNMAWDIAGDCTTPTWDSDPNAQMAAAGNGVYTLNYVVGTAGTHEFKFRSAGSWATAIGADFGAAANASVTTTSAMQTVQFQLDLPNGRWLAGNPAPAPVTNLVTFRVDMSAQILSGAWTPEEPNTIRVAGAFTSWGDGVDLTNNPALSGNASNVYSTVITIVDLPDTRFEYKFRATGGYESPASTGGQNRSFNLSSGSQVLPLVYYSDDSLCDLLLQPTAVTFVLQLTNGTPDKNGIPFDSANDQVFINGPQLFPDNAWATWNISLPQMINNPAGSDFYELTLEIPAGRSRAMVVKFGIAGAGHGSLDNEAAQNENHLQYIRATGSTFTMPVAQFGTNYAATRVEEAFGNLKAGPPSGGNVPITWLGLPCVTLQTRTSLTAGSWADLPATDATSSTNWPNTGGVQLFRLQKRSQP